MGSFFIAWETLWEIMLDALKFQRARKSFHGGNPGSIPGGVTKQNKST